MNGVNDGRIKFVMIDKAGTKILIRHQNGVLDDERETQIDKGYYKLARGWQMAIQKQMQLMEKEERAIFPAGWQVAIKNKKLFIKEKN